MGWLNKLYQRFQLARSLPRHWQLRPRTLDRRIALHVLVHNEYRLNNRLGPDDIVLDIGAHIGSFALQALRMGAGVVHGYEPDADNFRLLTHNLAPYGDRVHLHHAAVWRSDVCVAHVTMSNPFTARNTGAIRVEETGTRIDAVAFDEVIEHLTRDGQRIRLAKLDCEGAEWPILLTSQTLDRVDALCGEYHLGALPEAYRVGDGAAFGVERLTEALRNHGFTVEIQELEPRPFACGLFFARRV
jgi:FkbM family methyltransferase